MAIISKRYAHLNQADSGSLHRKLDATEAYITGSLTAAGAAEFQSTVHVQGAAALDSSLTVTGSAILGSTLEVQGNADMRDVLPNADLSYDLGSAAKRWAELHAGAASFTNLDVDYLDVAVTASVAQLTGSAGAVFSAGDILVQAGKVSASSDLEAGGALAVAGNADLNGQLDVALAAEFHSTLSASGNAQLGGTLTVAGNADLNGQLDVAENFSVASTKFSVIAASGDTSIAGDLVVSGDLTVMGDRIEAQVTQLRIEDGLITLMSGSPSRTVSDGAGVEVDVGDGQQGPRPALAFSNAEDAWTSNLDFNPTADLTYDLGIPSKRWRELNLSGDAKVGGKIDAGSLAVSGEATFGAGIAVTGTGSFTGDLSAASGSFSGDLSVVHAIDAASANISGLVEAGSLSVSGLSDLDALNVSGTAQFAQSIAVTGSGSFSGDLFAANLDLTKGQAKGDVIAQDGQFSGSVVIDGNLDVYQTATFHGTFAVPGAGSFGSLVVGGINMSPISSSSPVVTFNSSTAVMLTQTLVSGDMAKYEIEVIARQQGGSSAAAWKISVAASCETIMVNGNKGPVAMPSITAAATELSKEFFGALGANLDVDIQVSDGNIDVIAKGAYSAGNVYWDCQIVKKMVLDSATGARKY